MGLPSVPPGGVMEFFRVWYSLGARWRSISTLNKLSLDFLTLKRRVKNAEKPASFGDYGE